MALNLDGTTQYVTLGNGVNIANTRPFTAVALVDSTSWRTSGAYGCVMSQGRVWYGGGTGGWTFLIEAAANPRIEVGINLTGGSSVANLTIGTMTANTGLWLIGFSYYDNGATSAVRMFFYRYSNNTLTVETGGSSLSDADVGNSAAGDPFLIGMGWTDSAIEDGLPGHVLWAAVFDGDLIGAGTTLGGCPWISAFIHQGPWARMDVCRFLHSYQQGHANDISGAATRRNGTVTGSPSYSYTKALVTTGLPPGIAARSGLTVTPPFILTAPTFVAAGTAAFTATDSATVTPGLPAGWAADDVHILIAAGSNNLDWPEPSGWTKISPGAVAEDNTAAQRVEVWARRAVGGDTAPVLSTYTGTTVRGAQIYGVRGCSTHGPVEETISVMSRSNNAASATVTWATITPPHPQTRLLVIFAYEDDPTAASTITDWTAFDTAAGQRSSLGTDMLLSYANRSWVTEYTATGALTTTVSGGTFANSVNVGVLLAFISKDLTAFVEPPDPIAVQSAM